MPKRAERWFRITSLLETVSVPYERKNRSKRSRTAGLFPSYSIFNVVTLFSKSCGAPVEISIAAAAEEEQAAVAGVDHAAVRHDEAGLERPPGRLVRLLAERAARIQGRYRAEQHGPAAGVESEHGAAPIDVSAASDGRKVNVG